MYFRPSPLALKKSRLVMLIIKKSSARSVAIRSGLANSSFKLKVSPLNEEAYHVKFATSSALFFLALPWSKVY